ncbi:MAG: type IV pilus twitching motility protein PilT [Dehalococcoidia bacterium]
MDINDVLKLAAEKNASDIHLIAGDRPVLRIHGKLGALDSEPTTSENMAVIFESITNVNQRESFRQNRELDFSYALPNGNRFRVNACMQQGTISLVFRIIRSNIPSIEKLGLPPICRELILKPNGLVLLTGPTGCGKSTTLAAMIEYLNQTEDRRIITIEDPIEYAYTSSRCVISQREVGLDTNSFAAALKHALRQDPDVILVGEMRDMDTASMVLMAAETGHLVLSTGHASSVPISVERIVDLFPPHQQHLAQTRLAAVLQGVLCQELVPRLDGLGRVPAVEIMLANAAVRNLIRENKTHQLANVIRTSQQIGMCTMDEALLRLYHARLICREDVLSRCVDTDEVTRILGKPIQVDNTKSGSRQFQDEIERVMGKPTQPVSASGRGNKPIQESRHASGNQPLTISHR